MKVKNIGGAVIILAGVKINPSAIVTTEDFGVDFVYSDYQDEFDDALNNDSIIFLTDNDVPILNLADIAREFSHTSVTPDIHYDSKDFYYNFKSFDLKFGEIQEIEFKGYLKTLDLVVSAGKVDIQIVQPLMNKINVMETNNYVIDCDYKLLNPKIRITSKGISECSLYLDGVYKDSTKTKEQYLSEIYSESKFPKASVIPANSLLFKVNFMKVMTGDAFIDVIGKQIGNTFNNGTLKTFNKFEDGAYCKFNNAINIQKLPSWTFNIWFNFEGDTLNKQYLFYKRDVLEIYVYRGLLTFYIGKSNTRYEVPIKADKWQMLTIARSASNYNVYIDTKEVKSFFNNTKYTSRNEAYFGGYSYYTMRSAQIGEAALYNYHFSKGMVHYLYTNNNPQMQVQTNLISGCILNQYTNSSSLTLDNSYEFSIVEKENATADNILSSEIIPSIQGPCTGSLNIITSRVYFSADSKYDFKYTGKGKYFLTIDDRPILLNSLDNSFYIEEGYYTLKLVTTGDAFDVQFKMTDSVDFAPLSVFIEDTNDVAIQEGSDDSTVYFDLDNKSSNYGLTFADIPSLVFNNHIGRIDNITKEINSGVYCISFSFKHHENDALVFGQGNSAWNPNFELRVIDNKVQFIFKETFLNSDELVKDKWYNIQITSDGSNVFLYINGALACSEEICEGWELESLEPFYLNSMSQSFYSQWAGGEFELRNFKFYLKYFKRDEIINNYMANRIGD